MADLSKELSKELSKDFAYCEDALGRAENAIGNLPSAQPERTQERTKTHACDCISRAEAIELKPEFLNPNVNRKTKKQTAIDRAYARGWNSCNTHWIKEIIEDLPPAQPEIIRCKDCKWRDENWRRGRELVLWKCRKEN